MDDRAPGAPDVDAVLADLGLAGSAGRCTPLSHPGASRIVVVHRDAGDVVLKRYADEHHTRTEFSNLSLAQAITRVRVPRVYGVSDGWLALERLPGVLFDRAARAGAAPFRDYEEAARTLARLHGSLGEVDQQGLRDQASAEGMRSGIDRARARALEGLGAWEEEIGPVPGAWSDALDDLDVDVLVSVLAVGPDPVLGHGDYKPDNLVQLPTGGFGVIDWLNLDRAEPWYDLAYLTIFVTDDERDTLLGVYLDESRRMGRPPVPLDRARARFLAGQCYQQLIRGASNAALLRPDQRNRDHHVSEFRAALAGVADTGARLTAGPRP